MTFDPTILDELARFFAAAALDAWLEETLENESPTKKPAAPGKEKLRVKDQTNESYLTPAAAG